ncbi:MAG: hypothetical protein OXH76_05145 [Boseongicola sp.]|nr:hypothetical protein [Boseongicola sp.]
MSRLCPYVSGNRFLQQVGDIQGRPILPSSSLPEASVTGNADSAIDAVESQHRN